MGNSTVATYAWLEAKLLRYKRNNGYLHMPDGAASHFKISEFQCGGIKGPCPDCGGTVIVISELLVGLEKFRTEMFVWWKKLNNKEKFPGVALNRVYNCVTRNRKNGSKSTSGHRKAVSADINGRVYGTDPYTLALIAGKIPEFRRIGIYEWGIHADIIPPGIYDGVVYADRWDRTGGE